MPKVNRATPLSALIEEREQDVRDLSAIEEIAARNPNLVLLAADVIRQSNQVEEAKSDAKPSTDSVRDRTTNVGTTAAIIAFLKSHPDSTAVKITRGVLDSGACIGGEPKQAISATLAMLTTRGRLARTRKDGLNHYSLKE